MECSGLSAGMVGNKRGKKEKNKRKECGYVGGGGKKREKKEKKKRKEGEPTCAERKKKKRKKIYHNIFTIFLQ